MEIIAHESADHEVFCLRDQNRMAVLIMAGTTLVHGEAAGCFDDVELKSFLEEARIWLVARGLAHNRRSGEYVAVRPEVAGMRASG